jgi:hypothetical protein
MLQVPYDQPLHWLLEDINCLCLQDQSTKLIDQNSLRTENESLRQQLEEANKQLATSKGAASEASDWKQKYEQLETKYQESVKEKVEEKEQENKLQLNERIRFYKERYVVLWQTLLRLRVNA